MPLRIQSIHEDSPLNAHDVKVGDHLAHINAWSVRTKADVKVAYKTNDLYLALKRDREPYEIKLVADDLGITVEDENGEVFEVCLRTRTDTEVQTATKGVTPRSSRDNENEHDEMPASIVTLLATTWILFIATLFSSIYLMSNSLMMSVPGSYGQTEEVVNAPILIIICISMVSSIFFLALAHAVAHLNKQAAAIRSELKTIAKRR